MRIREISSCNFASLEKLFSDNFRKNMQNPNLPEKEFNLSCPQVRKNYTFFYKTGLSFERMCDISEWIGSLSKEQRAMLDDILHDKAKECQWDYA